MALNDPLTNKRIEEYVETMLGLNQLGTNSVEWGAATQKVVSEKVLRHFNRLVGFPRTFQINTFGGIQRYVLNSALTANVPDEVRVSQGIVEVMFPRISPGLQIDEFHILEQTFAPMTDVPSFLANRYSLEQLRMAIGSDRVWEEKQEDVIVPPAVVTTREKVLYVSPPPRSNEILAVIYLQNLETIGALPNQWHQWALDLSTAEAKIIIGGARRRFQGDLRQDGTELVSEGRLELKELLAQAERGGLVGGLVFKQF